MTRSVAVSPAPKFGVVIGTTAKSCPVAPALERFSTESPAFAGSLVGLIGAHPSTRVTPVTARTPQLLELSGAGAVTHSRKSLPIGPSTEYMPFASDESESTVV